MKKTMIFFYLLSTLMSFAQSGSLDSSFGIGGKAIYCYDPFTVTFSSVLQPDGKILVTGVLYDSGFVTRYNTDGSPDTTFGDSNIVTIPSNSTTEANLYTYCIALQPDGKIIVAGTATNNLGLINIIVIRLNANGTFDSSFGTSGKLNLDLGTQYDFAYAVTVQTDGKIIVGGSSGSVNGGFTLVRINANGTLDTTFGTAGKTVTIFIPGQQSQINSIAVQEDGKIVTGGFCDVGSRKFALARYYSNGSIDNTFGSGGKVVSSFSLTHEEITSIVLRPDGKIIAQGNTNLYGSESEKGIVVARYHSNGTLDAAFGSGGARIITGNGCNAFDVALQADGKIVLAGVDDAQLLIARLTSEGALDNSFVIRGNF